jgi:DNA anti-recombination protein RmuC
LSTIPPIKIAVEADTTKLQQGLKTATDGINNVNSSVKTASTGMSAFATQLKSVGAAMGVAFAGAQIVNFAKQSVMAASNMAESLSKVQVVFEDTAGSVIEWSKTSADSMGISSQKALEAAGTYGNLFQALGVTKDASQDMSVNLVQLAADLGSFNNMTVDDSLNALRSGLSGETEPLKRFGISLNDVTLKAKAMEMGFGQIKGVMDPAIKAQVTYALVLEQTKKAQGDYARTADGTANTMKTLQARLEDAKVALGEALMPAFRALLGLLNLIIPVLTTVGKFFKENKDAIKVFAIYVGALTAAFYAYRAALIVTKVTQQAFVVMQTIMKGATLASIASTNGLAASMLVLNAAMRANPIGLIVTALALVGAAFVMAWKKSETFRGVVIKGAQIILNGFALLVGGIGKLIGAFSKIPGMGWAKGLADGAKNAADSIRATSDGLSKLKNIAVETNDAATGKGGKGGTGGGGGGTTGGGTGTTNADKIKKYSADVKSIYKDMQATIIDAKERAAEALARRDERIYEAEQAAIEASMEAHTRYKEALASAEATFNQNEISIKKRHSEAVAAAQATFDINELSINKDYNEKKADLEKDLQKKLADIRQSAAKKTADLNKKAVEDQLKIVQQSMDRLRSAFASKTGANVADDFGGSTGSFIENLKKKLTSAKELQANAAALAGLGYSQVFIEEVVKNGPEAGNKIAEALKAASPEATKELQTLYGQVENVSNNGLNELAATMNAGGKLATQELMTAYSQVAIDLKESLAGVDAELKTSMAEANASYLDAVTQAAQVRDEKLAENLAAFTKAKAEAKKQLDESLAENLATFTKAKEDATKTLNESLTEIQKTLQKALLDAQKDYEKAIDEINKSTQKKLAELQTKLAETSKLLAELGAKQAAAQALANAPTYTSYGSNQAYVAPTQTGPQYNPLTGAVINTTVNTTNLTSPNAVATSVTDAIKYSLPVTVNTTTLAGIMAASTPKPAQLTSAQIVANRRAANGGYL